MGLWDTIVDWVAPSGQSQQTGRDRDRMSLARTGLERGTQAVSLSPLLPDPPSPEPAVSPLTVGLNLAAGMEGLLAMPQRLRASVDAASHGRYAEAVREGSGGLGWGFGGLGAIADAAQRAGLGNAAQWAGERLGLVSPAAPATAATVGTPPILGSIGTSAGQVAGGFTAISGMAQMVQGVQQTLAAFEGDNGPRGVRERIAAEGGPDSSRILVDPQAEAETAGMRTLMSGGASVISGVGGIARDPTTQVVGTGLNAGLSAGGSGDDWTRTWGLFGRNAAGEDRSASDAASDFGVSVGRVWDRGIQGVGNLAQRAEDAITGGGESSPIDFSMIGRRAGQFVGGVEGGLATLSASIPAAALSLIGRGDREVADTGLLGTDEAGQQRGLVAGVRDASGGVHDWVEGAVGGTGGRVLADIAGGGTGAVLGTAAALAGPAITGVASAGNMVRRGLGWVRGLFG